jgi:hypothetical protein
VSPTAHYRFAGLSLELSAAPPLLADAMARAFGLCRTGTTPSDVVMRGMFLRDGAFEAAMPPSLHRAFEALSPTDPPHLVRGPSGEIGVVARLYNGAAFTLCKPPHDRLDLYCQVFSAEPAPVIFQSVLVPLLSALLLRRGKLLMHAGCAVSPTGEALTLVADSGGGKTTTCLALAREGFRLLSDELVAISLDSPGATAEGILVPMNVDRRTARFFPELSEVASRLKRSGESKLGLDPRQLFGQGVTLATAPVSAVIAVTVRRRGPRLERVKGSTLLHHLLLNHSFARGEPMDERSLELLASLLGRTDGYVLETGHDPQRLGRYLVEEAAAGRFRRPG